MVIKTFIRKKFLNNNFSVKTLQFWSFYATGMLLLRVCKYCQLPIIWLIFHVHYALSYDKNIGFPEKIYRNVLIHELHKKFSIFYHHSKRRPRFKFRNQASSDEKVGSGNEKINVQPVFKTNNYWENNGIYWKKRV